MSNTLWPGKVLHELTLKWKANGRRRRHFEPVLAIPNSHKSESSITPNATTKQVNDIDCTIIRAK
jgi:hypothetical protein